MNVNLFYRIPNPHTKCLGKDLKFCIANYFFGQEGSLGSEWIEINKSHIPFLEGVAHANRMAYKDAYHLIDLLRKNNKIEIRLL